MRVWLVAPFLVLMGVGTAWGQDAAGPPSGTSGTGGSAGTTGTGTGSQRPVEVHNTYVTQQAPPPTREEEGDGRAADLIWVEGAFGYSYVNLVQFSETNFLPSIDHYKGGGYMAALAAGVRLSFLMIGARGTLSSYEWFDLWTIGADIHLRIPVGSLEPYVRIGAGYAFVGQADYDIPKNSLVDVFGLELDAGGGLDIYLDKVFAIGAGIDGVYLNLSRQRVDTDGCADMTCGASDISLSEDGDAAGLQIRIHGHASLHF